MWRVWDLRYHRVIKKNCLQPKFVARETIGMKFATAIGLYGASAKPQPGIPVPPEIVEALGAGKKPPVRVTIGEYSYRSTIASMGGIFLLPFSSEHRKATGLGAGDEITVELELDDAPRVVEVPEDLKAALDQNAAVLQAFEKLSYSNKQRMVLGIAEAKTEDTRQRRIAKAVADLEKTLA